ncbi:MAG: hypothetical protein PVH16_02300 [Thioalkalispiraceae bacterium]|jgi:hypothetical protein
MKSTILERYDSTADGQVIIDIATSRIEDLYDDFDRYAPYIRRDLKQDLGDYLIDCAKEIKYKPFIIRFSFTQAPGSDKESRIRQSINSYFLYLADNERENILQTFRKSATLLIIGLAILFLAVYFNQSLGESRSVVEDVFAEGLTIAAWVSLWESFAVFLIEWFPRRKNILLFRRLAHAPLSFTVGK